MLVPAATAHPTQSDAKLTALGVRFEQALAAQRVAQSRFNETERRYLDEGPDPPSMLTRAGALGKLLAYDGAWWRAHALRSLLRDAEQRAHWSTARAALPVALAYEARDRRFRRKIGLRDAEQVHGRASDAVDELAGLILAAPAGCPGGLAVKARVVKLWGKPEWWSNEASHADACERFAAQLIDSVIAAASV